jgi:hypothetical protein
MIVCQFSSGNGFLLTKLDLDEAKTAESSSVPPRSQAGLKARYALKKYRNGEKLCLNQFMER